MSIAARTTVVAPPQRETRLDVWVVVAFLFPISQLLSVKIIGTLYLTDMLGVALLFVLLRLPDALARLRRIGIIWALFGLWLGGQTITDLVHYSAPEDFLRGWAKIIFFAVQVAVLWLFLPRRRAYFLAFALGSAIAWLFAVPDQLAGFEWKFGYDRAAGFTIAGVLSLAIMRLERAAYLALFPFFLLVVFLLFENARSAALIAFVAASVCVAAVFLKLLPGLQARLNALLFGGVLVVAFGLAALAMAAYGHAAQSGALGADARSKYAEQTQGGVPLILGGRAESLIALRAIADSPLIGHGSWAKDRRYVEQYRALRQQAGMRVQESYFHGRDLIPTHSYILGAWVESGIFGGLFWLYIGLLPFVAIYWLMKHDEPLLPLLAYLAAGLLWAVPFSPFGASERFLAAFQIVALLWFVHGSRAAKK